jgi:LmeA-like phospholipid-binding
MSSDHTQPVPEWWQQPQVPRKEEQEPEREQGYQDYEGTQEAPAGQGYRDTQDSQATRQYPTNRGAPGGPTFTPNQSGQPDQGYQSQQGYETQQGYQPPASGFPSGQEFPSGQGYPSDQGYPSSQGYQPASGFPSGQPYQQDQDYRGNQGYQGPPGAQTYPANQGFPAAQGYQGPPARTRRRRRRWPWITLIVIVVVLVGADRAANAYAEDQMASQIKSSLALSGKPNVTIQGFPFLTQLAGRTFNTVDVNASNETAGPGGQLEIASLTATLHGMHIHGTNSATVDQFTASALVTFAALAHAGGIPQGITLAPDGPNQIKATVDILGFSSEATAKVTQVGDDKINVKITDFGGVPADVLGSLTDFNISIPKLPAGVKIQSISITQQGLRITASGQNTTLSQ